MGLHALEKVVNYMEITASVIKVRGGENKAPIIGKNVDIGFGAVIIGDVKIADNCVIGANAVVTKSFLEQGTVICGVPAREIKKND